MRCARSYTAATLCRPPQRASLKAKRTATAHAALTEADRAVPRGLEDSVAVLSVEKEGFTTRCYLLGVSHVSKVSCQQVSDLIDAVSPDIVCVELSKDRVGLLVDRDRQDSQTWQARQISLSGSTFSENWPSKEEVLKLVKTKKGVPIQIQDIEADVLCLLSTGLFSRGRPVFTRAEDTEAPAFTAKYAEGSLEVQTVPPLGGVEFEMRDRSLPPIISVSIRVDSSLKDYSIDEQLLQEMAAQALESSKEGTLSLSCYLTLRKSILDHCLSQGAKDAVTIFRGEEQGTTEVIIRARRVTDPVFVSGFEEGADGGYGWGIDPFRPANRPFKLSERMMIPTKQLQILTGNDGEAHQDPADTEAEQALLQKLKQQDTNWREWTENEAPLLLGDDKKKGVADYFGAAVTSLYGKLQGDAGRKVGVDPGAAWRAAVNASLRNAVPQIQLFDVPEQVSQKRIAESIFAGMGTQFAIAAAYGATLATLSHQSWFPDVLADNALWLGLVGCGALLWPVWAPYAEIAWLSAQSVESIEEAVRVKEPIHSDLDSTLKLFGEDALLDWPGAMDPVIRQRDQYMARNLFRAATNISSGAPAYVPDVQDDRVVCRLVMPEEGPELAAPMGTGDGVYSPLNGKSDSEAHQRSIVAIVGTAHVRGMCKEWEQLKGNNSNLSLESFLSATQF